jgi:hypothetical protein
MAVLGSGSSFSRSALDFGGKPFRPAPEGHCGDWSRYEPPRDRIGIFPRGLVTIMAASPNDDTCSRAVEFRLDSTLTLGNEGASREHDKSVVSPELAYSQSSQGGGAGMVAAAGPSAGFVFPG